MSKPHRELSLRGSVTYPQTLPSQPSPQSNPSSPAGNYADKNYGSQFRGIDVKPDDVLPAGQEPLTFSSFIFIGRITKDILYYDGPLVILIRGHDWRDPDSALEKMVLEDAKANHAFLADHLAPTSREFIGSIKSSTPDGDSYLCVELQPGDKDKLQSGEWTLLKLFMTRGQEEYFIATTMATVESIAVANANNCQCDFVAMERRKGPVEKSGDEYADLPGDATIEVDGQGVCDWSCERHGAGVAEGN